MSRFLVASPLCTMRLIISGVHFYSLLFWVLHFQDILAEDKNNCCCDESKPDENVFRLPIQEVPLGDIQNDTKRYMDIFREIGNDSDTTITSETVDRGYYTSLCWSEIMTLTELVNGSKTVTKEYAITFETQADIPPKYVELNAPEVRQYLVYDQSTKKSQMVNFITISETEDVIISQHRNMSCGSGPIYSKELIDWRHTNKKRLEIKVSPKRSNFKIGPPNAPLVGSSNFTTASTTTITPVTDGLTVTFKRLNVSTVPPILEDTSNSSSKVTPEPHEVTEEDAERNTTLTQPSNLTMSDLTPNTTERSTTADPTGPPSSEDTLIEVGDRIGLTQEISNSTEEKDSDTTFPSPNPHIPPCVLPKQKISIKVRVTMDHVLEHSLMNLQDLPLMSLEKQIEIPVESIREVPTVPNITINREWNRFLEDIGTHFFNLNEQFLVDFTDRFTNSVDESLDYEDIFPDETANRLKMLLKNINKCRPLLSGAGLNPPPEFRHLDNYGAPSYSPSLNYQHQQSSQVSSLGVPSEFLNELQLQFSRQYGTYPTWLIVKNVAPIFTSSSRLYEPPSQIRHRRREHMTYKFN